MKKGIIILMLLCLCSLALVVGSSKAKALNNNNLRTIYNEDMTECSINMNVNTQNIFQYYQFSSGDIYEINTPYVIHYYDLLHQEYFEYYDKITIYMDNNYQIDVAMCVYPYEYVGANNLYNAFDIRHNMNGGEIVYYTSMDNIDSIYFFKEDLISYEILSYLFIDTNTNTLSPIDLYTSTSEYVSFYPYYSYYYYYLQDQDSYDTINDLRTELNTLTSDYNSLTNTYNALVSDYNTLTSTNFFSNVFNAFKNVLSVQIIPPFTLGNFIAIPLMLSLLALCIHLLKG